MKQSRNVPTKSSRLKIKTNISIRIWSALSNAYFKKLQSHHLIKNYSGLLKCELIKRHFLLLIKEKSLILGEETLLGFG